MSHLTVQEEAEIRALSTHLLAKKNNVAVNGALIYETEDKKHRFEEEFRIVREELAARGILENSDQIRLIDGSELA